MSSVDGHYSGIEVCVFGSGWAILGLSCIGQEVRIAMRSSSQDGIGNDAFDNEMPREPEGVALLAPLSPMVLMILAAVCLCRMWPIYRRLCAGRDGAIFDCLEFRAMDSHVLLNRLLAGPPALRTEWLQLQSEEGGGHGRSAFCRAGGTIALRPFHLATDIAARAVIMSNRSHGCCAQVTVLQHALAFHTA